MVEEHGHILDQHAILEQRPRERVAEPVRVHVLDLGQLEHRIEIPRPVRADGLWLRLPAGEEMLEPSRDERSESRDAGEGGIRAESDERSESLEA